MKVSAVNMTNFMASLHLVTKEMVEGYERRIAELEHSNRMLADALAAKTKAEMPDERAPMEPPVATPPR